MKNLILIFLIISPLFSFSQKIGETKITFLISESLPKDKELKNEFNLIQGFELNIGKQISKKITFFAGFQRSFKTNSETKITIFSFWFGPDYLIQLSKLKSSFSISAGPKVILMDWSSNKWSYVGQALGFQTRIKYSKKKYKKIFLMSVFETSFGSSNSLKEHFRFFKKYAWKRMNLGSNNFSIGIEIIY